MTADLTPQKTFYTAGLVSLACHLVFAMTAGAYFLNREPVPVRQEVRVKIIEKKKPDKPELRKKQVQPKRAVVPVVQPVEITQPVQPQPVRVASTAVMVTEVQPVITEPVIAPSNAPQAKMIHSRALTARNSSAQAVRNVAVNPAPMASTHTVQPRATSVRSVETPLPVPVIAATVTPPQGTARSGIVSGRSSARRATGTRAVAPVVAPPVQVAALPPPQPVPSTDPGALDGYKKGLHRRLTFVAQKRYQRSSARRANQEGRVMVAFTVTRDGEVKEVYVKDPSRHAMLNQTALEAIKQAAPFTEFPKDILEAELNLVIPFSFTLR